MFSAKIIATNLMETCTKLQPLTPLQRADSTVIFNTASLCIYMHLVMFSSACVFDSLPFSKNMSSPTKIVYIHEIFLALRHVVFDKTWFGFSLQTSTPFNIYIYYRYEAFFFSFMLDCLKYFIKYIQKNIREYPC
jgi:hypothetical protein